MIVVAAMAVASRGKGQGEVYRRLPADLRDILRTVEVPLYMFDSSAATDALVDVSDPSAIVWKITADERPPMTTTARIVAEGDTGTRVTADGEGVRVGK